MHIKPCPASSRALLDVTHASAMPSAADLQDAWASAAAARGMTLHLERLAPAYLVTEAPAQPADSQTARVDCFRSIGQIAGNGLGVMSPEGAARMRRHISRILHGDNPPNDHTPEDAA